MTGIWIAVAMIHVVWPVSRHPQEDCNIPPAVWTYQVILTGLFGEHRGEMTVAVGAGPTINTVVYCSEQSITTGIPDLDSHQSLVRRGNDGYYRRPDVVTAERKVIPLPLSVGMTWTETLPTGKWKWTVTAQSNVEYAGRVFEAAFHLRAEGEQQDAPVKMYLTVTEAGDLLESRSSATDITTTTTLVAMVRR